MTRYQKRKRKGLCGACGKNKPYKKYLSCKKCIARLRKQYYDMKDATYEAYGGYKCRCCGETYKEFLQLDHIHGGGLKHRRKFNISSLGLYFWLKKNNYPPGFRILCANCNLAKGHSGYCPHKRKHGRKTRLL